MSAHCLGFTLIELLIVVSLTGIVASFSAYESISALNHERVRGNNDATQLFSLCVQGARAHKICMSSDCAKDECSPFYTE